MGKYLKQEKLYNPEAEGQPKIIIYGAGSIGSHVCISLAKTGFEDITVIDYDDIEEENMPAQFYSEQMNAEPGVSPLKIHQLQDLVSYMTNTEITVENTKITKTDQIKPSLNTIHIVAFDNIKGREIIYNALKGSGNIIIDGRIGGYNQEIYYVDTNEDTTWYETTLKGIFSEAECGEKTIWANNSQIAAKITSFVLRQVKGMTIPKIVKTNLLSEISIVQK